MSNYMHSILLGNCVSMLGAKPAVLMTSYHTEDFVEEEKNGRPAGQLYVQVCIVRGR